MTNSMFLINYLIIISIKTFNVLLLILTIIDSEENKIEYVELDHDYPSRILDTDILNSYNLKYSIHAPITDINIASLNPSIRNSSLKEIFYSFEIKD